MKYQKQTTRNRCHIMSANGIQKLIIPIKHSKKENESLHDYNAKIDNSQNWKVKHWKSIQNAYRSSPFFESDLETVGSVFSSAFGSIFFFPLVESITLMKDPLGPGTDPFKTIKLLSLFKLQIGHLFD